MRKLLITGCLAWSALAQNRPMFTEDFESSQIDSKVWEKRVQGAATLDLDQGDAAHG